VHPSRLVTRFLSGWAGFTPTGSTSPPVAPGPFRGRLGPHSGVGAGATLGGLGFRPGCASFSSTRSALARDGRVNALVAATFGPHGFAPAGSTGVRRPGAVVATRFPEDSLPPSRVTLAARSSLRSRGSRGLKVASSSRWSVGSVHSASRPWAPPVSRPRSASGARPPDDSLPLSRGARTVRNSLHERSSRGSSVV